MPVEVGAMSDFNNRAFPHSQMQRTLYFLLYLYIFKALHA